MKLCFINYINSSLKILIYQKCINVVSKIKMWYTYLNKYKVHQPSYQLSIKFCPGDNDISKIK